MTTIEPTATIEQFTAGEPGIYPDVPFETYLRCRLMSQSVLKQGRASMLHLKYAIDHAGADEPTDAMMLGSALHTAFLEPSLMHTKVASWTGARRAGKEWNEFRQANQGKAILTPSMYAKLTGMLERLRGHPDVRSWLNRVEAVEVSCIGELHGVPFRARADAMTDDPLWDLKKTACTDDRSIDATIYDYGYHIQAYIYRELFGRDRFCLGFVEESPPHDVRVVELSNTWMQIGRVETEWLINRYQQCLRTNHWPGRSDKIETREPPEWVVARSGLGSEITIAGAVAFAER